MTNLINAIILIEKMIKNSNSDKAIECYREFLESLIADLKN